MWLEAMAGWFEAVSGRLEAVSGRLTVPAGAFTTQHGMRTHRALRRGGGGHHRCVNEGVPDSPGPNKKLHVQCAPKHI